MKNSVNTDKESGKNAVIYARFSSHSQNEQSIEGQLKECYEYAKKHGYNVIGEYIDRAKSGTNDDRCSFQNMINDSYEKKYDVVLIYQYDRFARSRYNSAVYDKILSDNGVKLISVMEDIGEGASRVLIRGLFESMNEYYSIELSQKVRRGMAINAEKCLSNGSNPGLGYKVNSDRTFRVDEEEARTVKEIFERYNLGDTIAQIITSLNERGIKTSLGRDFKPTSLHTILRNKRYIGIYAYNGKEVPGGMPRILDDDLFYSVQEKLKANEKARARSRKNVDYLLTTKIFCGYCNAQIIGYSGKGKGKKYEYYACAQSRKHNCNKKTVRKILLEDFVISKCLEMLTDENMEMISKAVFKESRMSRNNLAEKSMKKELSEAKNALENLLVAIENGGEITDIISSRIVARQAQIKDLEARLEIERRFFVCITEDQVIEFLSDIKNKCLKDNKKRKAIINLFVDRIILYEDKITIYFKATNGVIEVPLNEREFIEGALNNYETFVSTSEIIAPPCKEAVALRQPF